MKFLYYQDQPNVSHKMALQYKQSVWLKSVKNLCYIIKIYILIRYIVYSVILYVVLRCRRKQFFMSHSYVKDTLHSMHFTSY